MSLPKEIGVIGLGRIGSPLCERLLERGYRVVGYDLDENRRKYLSDKGLIAVTSTQSFNSELSTPRAVILLLPAGDAVSGAVVDLSSILASGDTVLDFGNSHFADASKHANLLSGKGIGFLDVGTSGGVYGARHGACLTIGGESSIFSRYEPLFKDIAQSDGYAHVGPTGWGHLVKLVHNGIEYGFLQALAEGLHILKNASEDASISLDLKQICSVWSHGSIIEARLVREAIASLDLLKRSPHISGRVGGGETGSWVYELSQQLGIDAPVLEASLKYRKRTQENADYKGKVIAAIRNVFGEHSID